MAKQIDSNYFYEPYDTDIQYHRIARNNGLDSEQQAGVEKAKLAYAISQEHYSYLKRDNSLIAAAMADPVFKYRKKAVQNKFYDDRKQTLDKLLVNATTADRQAETKSYDEQLKKIQLAQLKTSQLAATKTVADQKQKAEEANKAQDTRTILEKIRDFFISLFTINPTAFVKWVGTLNLYRLSWTFSRISLKSTLLYLQKKGIIDQNGNFRGVKININILDAPNDVFNYLSVCFFLAKILVNASLPFKHAFAPTNEAEKGIEAWTRFKMELSREWVNFFNDGWWIFLNAITNFPKAFGVSVPIAGWILTGALFFDALLLIAVSYWEEKEMEEKIKWLRTQLESTDPKIVKHHDVFRAMLKQTEIQRTGFRTLIRLLMFATVLFIISLAITLSIASPIVAPVGFFACVLAVALILSREEAAAIAEVRALRAYNKGVIEGTIQTDDKEEKQILAENWESIDKELSQKEKEAWKTFGYTFAEHVFVPMIIVGVYTICWPAAIVLTVMYIACKCIDFEAHKETYHDNDPGNAVGGGGGTTLTTSVEFGGGTGM